MDVMNTYSGKIFSPIEPMETDIEIGDIAHALSQLCRGNGHLRRFFSVGQHSINCSLEAKARGYSKRVQLALLLHDASEAYIADMIRPVKKYISGYYEVEARLQNCIYVKYLKSEPDEGEAELIRQVDDDMLQWELDDMLICDGSVTKPQMSNAVDLGEKAMREVEEKFLELFKEITSELFCLN